MTVETISQLRRSPRLRSLVRGLRLPAILLPLIAASPGAILPPAAQAPVPSEPIPSEVIPTAAAAGVTAGTAGLPAAQVAPAAMPVPAVVRPALSDARGLSPNVLAMALDAVECARARGISGRDDLLTVIDYSLPSDQPRLWVLDLARGKVLYHELVAHGKGTGDRHATRFSNTPDSLQTSLGLFLTGGTYHGGNGYSLRLKGLDKGVNDRAEARHIVMHGAWYVNPEHARQHGRIGRSWGCPALSDQIAPTVIDLVKGGSFVFAYGGDESWIRTASNVSGTCSSGAGFPTVKTAG